MTTKYRITFTALLTVSVLSALAYAKIIGWKVNCSTKGCPSTFNWTGEEKVAETQRDGHKRQYPSHSVSIETKSK